jgi:hypothetical protein
VPKGVAVRIRARAYPSSTSCHCSSAVEHPIRNRAVVGSSPTSGSAAEKEKEKAPAIYGGRSTFVGSQARCGETAVCAVDGGSAAWRVDSDTSRTVRTAISVSIVPRIAAAVRSNTWPGFAGLGGAGSGATDIECRAWVLGG